MNILHWYAHKVFHNRFSVIECTLKRDGIRSYIPTRTQVCIQVDGSTVEKHVPITAMLMFLQCDDAYISSLNRVLAEKAMVYHHPGTQIPAPIPDKEMELFIQLIATMEKEFEIIPFNTSLVTADEQKYRVVEGEYIGAEGYYKRIRDNKRLIVTLGDLLMPVSTNYIPRRYLQPASS